MTPNKWNKARIIAQLRQYQREGVDLHTMTLLKHNRSLLKAIYAHFGPFAKAMKAAGIPHRRASRAIYRDADAVLKRIRQDQRAGKDLSYLKVWNRDIPLVRAAERYIGSWKAALEASGIDYERIRRDRGIDPGVILQRLKQLYRQKADISSTTMYKNRRTRWIVIAARNHFGSYTKALRAAGIDPISVQRPHARFWTREKLIATIQKLHSQGKDLSTIAMLQTRQRVFSASFNMFGNWRRAIEAAGIDYAKVRKYAGDWNAQKIIDELRRLKAKGENLSPRQMGLKHHSLFAATTRWHGSYQAALEKAGIDYLAVRQNRIPWTSQAVLDELRTLHAAGKDLSMKHIGRTQGSLYASANRHFSSYHAALAKAGIDWRKVCRVLTWTDQDVIKELKKLYKPDREMIWTQYQNLYAVAKRHFGSFPKALEAAGLPIPDRMFRARRAASRHWNESSILQRLRELNRAGTDLRDRTMKTHNVSLYWAAKDYFGTYINAVMQAGIDYDRVVQRVLRKQRRYSGALAR